MDEGGFGPQGFFTKDKRLIFSVGVAENKVLWLKLSTSGPSGHGSMPLGENVNFIMAQAMNRVASYETPIRITPVVAEMIKRLGRLFQILSQFPILSFTAQTPGFAGGKARFAKDSFRGQSKWKNTRAFMGMTSELEKRVSRQLPESTTQS